MNKVRTIIIDDIEIETSLSAVEIANLSKINAELKKENEKLKERINKIEKHVSSLSSIGRGCEIYADVKREILKVVRGDNK